jgi:hypothetical protein
MQKIVRDENSAQRTLKGKILVDEEEEDEEEQEEEGEEKEEEEEEGE